MDMELDFFLKEADLTLDEWDASKCEWGNLLSIYNDFVRIQPSLVAAAKMISSRIQQFDRVHSVRWRIKSPIGLLKKIVRKNLEEKPKDKWVGINKDNYVSVVTDLIGVRALHLFKDDCVEVDQAIRDVWELAEEVVVYIRDGDKTPSEIQDRGGIVKVHDDGYRSIHYIVRIQPEKTTYYPEIQVRTIFQEGWSEIDHTIRYPDFSDNEQIAVFLRLFSGLAGSADEMGLYAKELSAELKKAETEKRRIVAELEQAIMQRDKAMHDIESTLQEMEDLKLKDEKSQVLISRLKSDVHTLQNAQERFRKKEALDKFTKGNLFGSRVYGASRLSG
ncbi:MULTISPECIES: RelA/SpoT domain-containing protein [Pseudomonas]|uniref:RelA/SpoT domain-containing protein n=1 Tax=Pseudomonas TaxID=286 RepID=UPI002B405E74|nr:hypothetical protein [Pseudomonas sichuanensis]